MARKILGRAFLAVWMILAVGGVILLDVKFHFIARSWFIAICLVGLVGSFVLLAFVGRKKRYSKKDFDRFFVGSIERPSDKDSFYALLDMVSCEELDESAVFTAGADLKAELK